MANGDIGSEMEAEIFIWQATEWMKKCSGKQRCPMAKIFGYMMVVHQKNIRLETELNRIRDYPNEC